MSNPNKALWDSVKVTDPHAVKPITGKPYKGNSPKPYWLIERATDVFGPIGIGWGVNVKSERFERLSEHDVLHVAVVSVWIMRDGQRSESFDQMGGTKAAYMSKNGLVVDEDAGKKSVTDGMVKCLSMLGFAGDIFSGQWDDSKYIDFANEYHRQREDPNAEKMAQRTAELEELALFLIDCHEHDKDMDAVRVWYDPTTWRDEDPFDAQEEKKYVWGLMKQQSKLRATIKANAPA